MKKISIKEMNPRKIIILGGIIVAALILLATLIWISITSIRFNRAFATGEKFLSNLEYRLAMDSFELALSIRPKSAEAQSRLVETVDAYADELISSEKYDEAKEIVSETSNYIVIDSYVESTKLILTRVDTAKVASTRKIVKPIKVEKQTKKEDVVKEVTDDSSKIEITEQSSEAQSMSSAGSAADANTRVTPNNSSTANSQVVVTTVPEPAPVVVESNTTEEPPEINNDIPIVEVNDGGDYTPNTPEPAVVEGIVEEVEIETPVIIEAN